MAEQPASAPVSLRFPLGLDNLAPETSLPDGALRESVNVDHYPTGQQRIRSGLRQIDSGRFGALFAPSHGRFLLAAKGDALVGFDGANFATLATGINGSAIAFAEMDGEVYWVDGASRGRVTPAGSAALWGLPTPPSIVAYPVSSGGLASGTYRVAMVAKVNGIESGAAEPSLVQVSEGGGIAVTVPVGAEFSVYRTPPNGSASDLFWAADVASGGSAVLGGGGLGKPLRSLHAIPPIPGTAIAAYRGRLFVASGDTLRFTSAYSRHWMFRAVGYFRPSDRIVMLGAVEDGLYIGTDREVLFLAGADPDSMALRQVSSVGSVSPAAEIAIDSFVGEGARPARQCAWIDADGFLCVGKEGGIVVRPHRGRYCMGDVRGATLAEVRRAGLRQVVVGVGSREDDALAQVDSTLLSDRVFEHGAAFS